MDIATLAVTLGIIGSIATVMAFLYSVIFGPRGLVEYFENRHRSAASSDRAGLTVLPKSKDYSKGIEPVSRDIMRGDNQKALTAIEEIYGLDELNSVSDPLSKATILLHEGEARAYLGQKEAIGILREVIDLIESTTTHNEYQSHYKEHLLGRAHNDIGYVYRSFRDYGDAVKEYLRALPHLRLSSNEVAYSETLRNLGYVYSRQGKLESAELICRDALELSRKTGDRRGEALSQNTLGLVYVGGKQYDFAQINCESALSIFESLENSRGIGLALNALGNTLRRLGATNVYPSGKTIQFFQEAKRLLARSADIFSKLSEPLRLVEAQNELGCVYRDWAKFYRLRANRMTEDFESQALEHLQQSRTLAAEKEMVVEEIDALEDLAELKFNAGDSRSTLELLDETEALIPKEYRITETLCIPKIPEPISEFWAALGKVSLLRGHLGFDGGNLKEASRYYLLASTYFGLYAETNTLIDYALPSIYARLRCLSPDELVKWRKHAKSYQDESGVENIKLMQVLDDTMGVLETGSDVGGN